MRMINKISLIFLWLIISIGFSSFNNNHIVLLSHQSRDTIKVDGGYITGISNTDKEIKVYKGIPFAAPPVGALRWMPPQPVIPWTGVKECTAFGASPMQGNPVPFSMWSKEFLIPDKPISEDCLYLNVWTRAKTSNEKLPVLVWIYGGGFASGGSGAPIYDGEAMAKKGIVFVSINYRVGIFGFFAHPELTKESVHHASGNYGLMDQLAALEWVQKNIAAFGGDADNVTIAGQSAGSMSVNCLVASPLAKGLFKHAIGESGASFVTSTLLGSVTLQKAENDGVKTAESLHANTISDLRKIPADELMKAQQSFRGPIVDGYVLPESIASIFANDKENKVTLLTGWNEDEGFVEQPKTADGYKKNIESVYGNNAAQVLHYYPATNDSIAAISQVHLSRDIIFGVQNYTWANMQSKAAANVYVYRFTRKPPATGRYLKYGAFHTAEVPYAYNNLQFVNRPWLPVDRELANVMNAYFANFIKTGNPNGNDLPQWPAYSINNQQVMILGEQQHAKYLPGKEALDFLYGVMKEK